MAQESRQDSPQALSTAGLALETKQDSQITELQAIKTASQAIQTAVEVLDNIVSGSEAQVDVVTSALPTGASTAARQDTSITALQAIQTAVEVLDNIVSGSEAQVDVVTSALPTGASTAARQDTSITALQAIQAAVEVLDNIVSGSEAQVDVVTSALPAGASTAARQDTGNTSLSTIATNTNNLSSIATNTNRLDVVNTAYIQYSSSNLPGNASSPLELVASLSADAKKVQVWDTAGFPFEIMTGSAASEVRAAVFGPGAAAVVELEIASGTRVSVRRLDNSAAVSVGDISVNFVG
jgi:PBP1b-binding outer membrane lipoprotein LpoB